MKNHQIITGFIVFFSLLPQFSGLAFSATQNGTANVVDSLNEIRNSLDTSSSLSTGMKSSVGLKEYWAVLIGINDYRGDTSDLPWSVNEITCFKNTLLSSGNWKEDHIQVLLNYNATKENITNAIEWLDAHEDSNDVSIFYFVGHGSTDSDHQYLVVYNAKISDEELKDQCDMLEGHVVVIIDSCYSGGFIEELKDRKRVVLTACGKEEFTYQDSHLQSGFFGYFINLTLSRFTTTVEMTFLFAYPQIKSYCRKVSDQYGEDYMITPRMSDGSIFFTKVVKSHLNGLLPKIIDCSLIRFSSSWRAWRM